MTRGRILFAVFWPVFALMALFDSFTMATILGLLSLALGAFLATKLLVSVTIFVCLLAHIFGVKPALRILGNKYPRQGDIFWSAFLGNVIMGVIFYGIFMLIVRIFG